jgi:hypothetical protein
MSFFLRKPLLGGAIAGVGVASAVAWQSRPLSVTDHGQEWNGEADAEGWHRAGGLQWNDKLIEFDEPATSSVPVRIVRAMLLTLVTGAAQVAVRGLNQLHIVGNREDWDAFQKLVIDRPKGTLHELG